MTACGSVKHIFEIPLPEKNPSSLIASLSSWKHQITTPPTSADHHSFIELFGEFHYKDTNTQLFSSSPLPSPGPAPSINGTHKAESYQLGSNAADTNKPTSGDNNKISHMNSNSLELCTEGLGSESLDDAEYSNKGRKDTFTNSKEDSNSVSSSVEKSDEICSTTTAAHRTVVGIHHHHQYRKSRNSIGRTFPPPISSIGRSGKPCVYFKSYRQDGRFVLQEVRIPTQEFLHASREDGRLRLRFVQPESDVTDTEEEEVDGDGDGEEVICEEKEEEGPIE